MCESVVADHPGLRVCGIEQELGERSWTIDTIEALRQQNPDTEFSWVIGSDLLGELHLWSRWEELRGLIRFVVLGRGTATDGSALPEGGSFLVRDFHLPDISSTEIRDLLHAGGDVRHLVPQATFQYLQDHPDLYR